MLFLPLILECHSLHWCFLWQWTLLEESSEPLFLAINFIVAITFAMYTVLVSLPNLFLNQMSWAGETMLCTELRSYTHDVLAAWGWEKVSVCICSFLSSFHLVMLKRRSSTFLQLKPMQGVLSSVEFKKQRIFSLFIERANMYMKQRAI